MVREYGLSKRDVDRCRGPRERRLPPQMQAQQVHPALLMCLLLQLPRCRLPGSERSPGDVERGVGSARVHEVGDVGLDVLAGDGIDRGRHAAIGEERGEASDGAGVELERAGRPVLGPQGPGEAPVSTRRSVSAPTSAPRNRRGYRALERCASLLLGKSPAQSTSGAKSLGSSSRA